MSVMATNLRKSLSRQGSRTPANPPMSNNSATTDRRGSRANLQSRRSVRSSSRLSTSKQSDGMEEEITDIEPVNPQQQAWDTFSDHVKVISMSDMFHGEKKEMYQHLSSSVHKQIIDGLRFQAKNLIMKTRVVEAMEVAKESDSETETDPEEEAERERKRAIARQHWGVIRRYVQDRIKQRRRNKGGWNKEKSFNRLRAQAKINLKPEQVRQELFIKYGIIPKPGRSYPEDTMKPVYSTKAKDIVAKFEQIHMPNLRDRPKSMGYGSNMDTNYHTTRARPRTIHTYIKPLNL